MPAAMGHGKNRVNGAALDAILPLRKCDDFVRAAAVRKISGPYFCAGEMGELGKVHLARAIVVHVNQLVEEDLLHLRRVCASGGQFS